MLSVGTLPTPVTGSLEDGEVALLASPMVLPRGAGGRGLAWIWGLPLILLWNRRQQARLVQQHRAAAGLRVPRAGLLVLTDRRLLLFDGGRRPGRVVDGLVGAVPREDVLSVTNNSVGDGWRTLRVALVDGRRLAVAVHARDVGPWLEMFRSAVDEL
jgi:hypothetical protein